jgi:hypothetical protein
MSDENDVDLDAFAQRDRHDDAERILTQVLNGVSKHDADTVVDAQTSALWDALVDDVERIGRLGGIVVYGYPARDD